MIDSLTGWVWYKKSQKVFYKEIVYAIIRNTETTRGWEDGSSAGITYPAAKVAKNEAAAKASTIQINKLEKKECDYWEVLNFVTITSRHTCQIIKWCQNIICNHTRRNSATRSKRSSPMTWSKPRFSGITERGTWRWRYIACARNRKRVCRAPNLPMSRSSRPGVRLMDTKRCWCTRAIKCSNIQTVQTCINYYQLQCTLQPLSRWLSYVELCGVSFGFSIINDDGSSFR